MVTDEAIVTKFWKLQILGNGDSLYYFHYFSVGVKTFIYKITKLKKNPKKTCPFHYNHSFQTWVYLRIHIVRRILGLIPKISDFVYLGMGPVYIFRKSSSESDTDNLHSYLKIIHLHYFPTSL